MIKWSSLDKYSDLHRDWKCRNIECSATLCQNMFTGSKERFCQNLAESGTCTDCRKEITDYCVECTQVILSDGWKRRANTSHLSTHEDKPYYVDPHKKAHWAL